MEATAVIDDEFKRSQRMIQEDQINSTIGK